MRMLTQPVLRSLLFGIVLFAGACPRSGAGPQNNSDLSMAAPDLSQGMTNMPDGAAGPDLAVQDADTGTISGTSIGVFLQSGGELRKPDDLTKVAIAALSGTGADTATFPAAAKVDGTFTIASVPKGPYWLRHGTDRFVYTSSRSLELNHYHVGRPDGVQANSSTQVTFNLTGLDPWQMTDDLQVVIPNLAIVDYPLGSLIDTGKAPNTGDSVINGASVDWLDIGFGYLVDSGKADAVVLTQLVGGSAGGVSYQALTRSLSLPAFTLTDGMSATLTGAFTDSAPSLNPRVAWRRSQFETLRTRIHAMAQPLRQDGKIVAYPAPLARGELLSPTSPAPAPGATLLQIQTMAGNTDLDLGSPMLRNPFPASYGVYGRFSHQYVVPYSLPGVTVAGNLTAELFVALPVDQLTAAGVAPVVAPVANVLIGNMPAAMAPTGVGVTPAIAWDAPAMGVPTGYVVTLWRLSAQTTSMGRSFVRTTRAATFYTAQRSFTMPPGVLTPMNSYCLQIRAYVQPGMDLTQRPYQDSVPKAYADALTPIFKP